MIKIGIDLSTTKTGVALIHNDKLMLKYEIKLFSPYSEFLILDNYLKFKKEFSQVFNYITNLNSIKGGKIIVGIELANFQNAKLTQRFSEYAGLVEAIFFEKRYFNSCDFRIVKFNSNQWQKLIGCNVSDTREVRKAKAKEFVYNKFKLNIQSEDVNDAICIAYQLHKLYSTEQTTKNVISKSKQSKTRDKRMIAIYKKIATREKWLKQLNPVRNKVVYERTMNEIKELQEQLEKE